MDFEKQQLIVRLYYIKRMQERLDFFLFFWYKLNLFTTIK